jgi:4-amino-4-deoxy-L-arabinose transferase-like glycosyltransferase
MTGASRSVIRPARARDLLAVFAAQAAILSVVALARFVAVDEGFYAIAAKEVVRGELPYRDFFYPQMPLLPFVYAAWIEAFGASWVAARILSALLAAATGTLLYWRLRRSTGRGTALAAAAAYASSGMVVAWFTTVKTHALTAFLLVGAYCALHLAGRTGRALWHGLAGFLLVLAVEVRLMTAILLAVFPLVALGEGPPPRKRAALLAFLAGGAVAALPLLFLAIPDLDRFWFNNLGYHLARRSYEPQESALQKLATAASVLGLRASPEHAGFQLPLLIVANAAYATFCRAAHRRVDAACWIALALFVVGLAPSPSWLQYFSVMVPFLVAGAAFLVEELRTDPRAERLRASRTVRALGAIAALVHLHGAAENVERFARSGEDAITFRRTRLGDASAVARAVDRLTLPGERIVSDWPGHVFESHADVVDGTENQFSARIERKLTTEQIERYRLMPLQERLDTIRRGDVRVAVLPAGKAHLRTIEDAGFRQVAEIGGALIFEKEGAGGPRAGPGAQ